MRTLRIGRGNFHAVAYALGGRGLVSLNSGLSVRFWDLGRFTELLLLSLTADRVTVDAHVTVRDNLLVLNKSVWDVGPALDCCREALETGRKPSRPKAKSLATPLSLEGANHYTFLSLVPGGGLLAGVRASPEHSGGQWIWRAELLFWDDQGQCQARAPLPLLSRPTLTVFSADGRTFAATAGKKDAVLCDPSTGQEKARLHHTDSLECLLFSPDGRLLAAAAGRSVWLWDTATHRAVSRFEGFQTQVESLAFHPGGRLLAAGSRGGTVRLWDVRGLKEVACYDWGVGAVHGLAFAPDGLMAAAAGHRNAIALWDVEA